MENNVVRGDRKKREKNIRKSRYNRQRDGRGRNTRLHKGWKDIKKLGKGSWLLLENKEDKEMRKGKILEKEK